ncbi:amidohydrolase family protein [Vibrio natriegens]|uniref:2-pyrone-4,6-dicarboxylate hydrolase n=1 Tax=Vibrio natriegens NBRC 15636 = ATCC 14048 = DSM 759 TaxID=1219067 RepID=A0AAN0Y859_VIBNA|nr:amidohydrolase family protein [Vibrio natriegens]ALR17958.1 2-pyrone-4,6-dicarboxylate hydrolase [Vibrio natriegens NBRC 15636 = ATCC 14048 = DSM 759]ANQ15452.1 2-pyrone-4,6-dicarboxylate hydrolase [Vibrio natriegens NBRC 15636 = ATCC 14048 = DSM 759]EPM41163.1 2-pyrone-4,6-dicarboxylate hydrolase [Vibrio natriegens NBRC 15636 = ATCC 14048 = DSM 759]MDX6029189.1 amidohydrolase family protein [Vibrio natriegens NBRC 15636 = ATCC 14048 = DSM 759]UUI14104.1 amidohydrolase family protein [Vibri
MDKDYLPFHPNPSKPEFKVPEGAVDSHCHVFGPASKFPYSPKRKYTPCDASKEQLFALRDYLGFSRNVIVQASCHGTDNAALVDALNTAGDLARGIAFVDETVTDEELQLMDKAGVRGVRFNFVKRLVDTAPKETLKQIAEKIRPLGWHVVVYFEAQDIDEVAPFLKELDMTVVIDHMGRPDVSKGVYSEEFEKFINMMESNPQIWTKVSCPERLTLTPPDYSDVVPFARELVERFPERVLWGTDWPHPNMKSHTPDDGHLVDVIPKIAPSEELQQALLVTNPMKLYWPEEV